MDINFALDLKVARRRSGLSQHDIAHLLGTGRTRVSKLERGTVTATATDLACFCLIYANELPSVGAISTRAIEATLRAALLTLPNLAGYAAGTGAKAQTLRRLAARLSVSIVAYDD